MEENKEKSNDFTNHYGSGIIENNRPVDLLAKQPVLLKGMKITMNTMEDEIMEKAKELRQMILESHEYQKYELYRKLLLEDEKLYQEIYAFREKNFKYQLTGELDGFESIEKLLERYEKVMQQPVVYAYLNAELVLCKKLQAVSELLMEDLKLDIDFLEE